MKNESSKNENYEVRKLKRKVKIKKLINPFFTQTFPNLKLITSPTD